MVAVHVKVGCTHRVRVRVWTVKGILVAIKMLSIPHLEFLACVFCLA